MNISADRPAGSVDPKLLEILVCPLTKGPLEYDAGKQELISRSAKLAYPIRDGIPIMLADEARALDWELLDAPAHEGVRRWVRDLNHAYRSLPALHARDCEGDGFEWLVADDALASVFAWIRRAPGAPPVAVVCNMTPSFHSHYRLPLPYDGVWHEALNSDATIYGGSGQGNLGQVIATHGAALVALPPLSALMLVLDET